MNIKIFLFFVCFLSSFSTICYSKIFFSQYYKGQKYYYYLKNRDFYLEENHRIAFVAINFLESTYLENKIVKMAHFLLAPLLRKNYTGYFLYRNMTGNKKKERQILNTFLSKLPKDKKFTYDLLHFGHGGEAVNNFHQLLVRQIEKTNLKFEAKLFINTGCEDGKNQEYYFKYLQKENHRPQIIVDNPKDTIGFFILRYFLKKYLNSKNYYSAQYSLALANKKEKRGLNWNIPLRFFKKMRFSMAKRYTKFSRGDFKCTGKCFLTFSQLHASYTSLSSSD